MADDITPSQRDIVEYVHGLVQRELSLAVEQLEKKALKFQGQRPFHVEELEARISGLEEWRLQALCASTLGIPLAALEDEQVIPVRYFIDSSDIKVADDIEDALEITLHEVGFRRSATYPRVKGSWFRRFFYSSKKRLTPEEIAESFAKIERAAGVRALDVPQSQVDLNRAEGVSKLLTSLEATPSALIQIGSILLLKIEGTPFVLNLTPQELSELERTPSIFKSPPEALAAIQKMRQIADTATATLPASGISQSL